MRREWDGMGNDRKKENGLGIKKEGRRRRRRRREKRGNSINDENGRRIEREKWLSGNMHGLKKIINLNVILQN